MTYEGSRVVAHQCNGDLIRGRSTDFRPGRATFAVTTAEGFSVRVLVDDLKAVFFVKSLVGDPAHVQDNAFDEEPRVGRRVWVEFLDGENLAGRAPSVSVENEGFFLFPSDSRSNLERAWIVLKSTKDVLFDEDALEAARRYAPQGPPPSVRHVSPDQWDEMLGLEPPARGSDCESSSEQERLKRKPSAKDSGIFLGDW